MWAVKVFHDVNKLEKLATIVTIYISVRRRQNNKYLYVEPWSAQHMTEFRWCSVNVFNL